jgi:hypothetical protein
MSCQRNNQASRDQKRDSVSSGRPEDSDREIKISFYADRHFERHARVSWLRSAYLPTFAVFGYRYVFQPPLAVVRRQIAEPEIDHIRHSFPCCLETTLGTSGASSRFSDLAREALRRTSATRGSPQIARQFLTQNAANGRLKWFMLAVHVLSERGVDQGLVVPTARGMGLLPEPFQ